MRRIFNLGVFLVLLVSLAMPAAIATAASGPQTYHVLVGADNVSRGISLMSFFPGTLRVHVGDKVVWDANSHEIHTVTFLAGAPLPALIIPAPSSFPEGTLMLNPQAAFPTVPPNDQYDGTTYANSGLLSTDPGQQTQFSLTFTQQGTFDYICVVHGVMMSGKVEVVADTVRIPSPTEVSKIARFTAIRDLFKSNRLFAEAMKQVPAPVHNPDGTTTHTVMLGFSKGSAMLMDFFPKWLFVRPGDTVNFVLPKVGDAPHTATFLNGGSDIPFVLPTPNPNPNPQPPVYLIINPQVLMPINMGQPLTRNGVFSSGLLMPGGPGPTSYQIKIGDISGEITYQCLLHDTSGMIGHLWVMPMKR
jgi:plastocyanin